MRDSASDVLWPWVANERGWRGRIDPDCAATHRTVYVEFFYNSAPPERPDARVEFYRNSTKWKKWRWREGEEQGVVVDALQTAAEKIAERFEWNGR